MKPIAWWGAAAAFVMLLPLVLAAVAITTIVPAAMSADTCVISASSSGPWRVPLTGSFRVTSGFGMRFHPILQRTKLHTGTDLVASDRTVVAAAAGVVTTAGFNTAYGNQVVIDHAHGIATRYGHLATTPAVRRGEQVTAGTRLGIEGQTGYATGIHLHFEVIDHGTPIDPKPFMAARGAPLDGSETMPVESATGDVVTATRGDGQRITLQGVQLANASVILAVGAELGVAQRGQLVALMAALQESTLRNVPYGDRDSLGLFQQRAGWGTARDRQDPRYAARAFFGGPTGPNHGSPRGLLDVEGWRTLGLGQAAQAVQVSAFPTLYDRWETIARALIAGLDTDDGCGPIAAGSLRVATWNVCLEFCPDLAPWRTRVPVIAAQLIASGADVIALQETGRLHPQGGTLSRALRSSYRVAAYHRSKMILVNAERLAATDRAGHELPGREFTVGGRGGVAQVVRSRITDTEIVVVSLHPMTGSTEAADRRRVDYVSRAHRIAESLSDSGRRPIVEAGDFNSNVPGTRTHRAVAEFFEPRGYRTAERLADHRFGARYASYNGGHVPRRGRRIDHVIVSAATPVSSWRQVLAPDLRHPPSDHHLIVVDLTPTISGRH